MGAPEDGSSPFKAPNWIVIPGISAAATDTRDAIDKAHELEGKTLDVWPGNTFSTDTEAGNGLLGTAHGQGPSFFLSQHKAWFGQKKIDKITAWRRSFPPSGPPSNQDLVSYNLLFEIVDVPVPGKVVVERSKI
jgi:hypothetical protein